MNLSVAIRYKDGEITKAIASILEKANCSVTTRE
jgi:hypothetical protein